MPASIGGRFGQHFVHIGVLDVDLGLIADVIGYGADQADRLVPFEMVDQRPHPTWSDMGIIVE